MEEEIKKFVSYAQFRNLVVKKNPDMYNLLVWLEKSSEEKQLPSRFRLKNSNSAWTLYWDLKVDLTIIVGAYCNSQKKIGFVVRVNNDLYDSYSVYELQKKLFTEILVVPLKRYENLKFLIKNVNYPDFFFNEKWSSVKVGKKSDLLILDVYIDNNCEALIGFTIGACTPITLRSDRISVNIAVDTIKGHIEKYFLKNSTFEHDWNLN